jgi:hypothetical protein
MYISNTKKMKYLLFLFFLLLFGTVKSFNNVENCTAFSAVNTEGGTQNTVQCTSSFLICYPDTIVFTGNILLLYKTRIFYKIV